MLKEQIKADTTSALKSGNQELLGVLRFLLSVISQKEKEKRYALAKEKPNLTEEELATLSALSDEETIKALFSEVKKRKEAIDLYQQGNRPELAEKEQKEIAILQKYLPEPISEEALKKMVQEVIEKTGAKEIKDMGKIIADLMPKIKGRAENSEISRLAKELLTK